MEKKAPLVLIILLVAGLIAGGCIVHRTGKIPQSPCGYQEPVVGAWVYDPGGMGDAVFLYIFKDYGRFDAVAVPRIASEELDYEVWITGTWEDAGDSTYVVDGQIIRHDFTTDSHETFPYTETLSYDATRDILINKDHPRGIFTRISCKPQIPPGMNISIPYD
jgi:hypothetical protein